MKKLQMTLEWRGTFIELCTGRVMHAQKALIDSSLTGADDALHSLWYDNKPLLRSLFDADNWWSVDDLDHTMGLVFSDRSALDARLAEIRYAIDGVPASIDPEVLQLSSYAPESIDASLDANELVICHGARRETVLHLEANVKPPFDPSLISLSFITNPDYGTILIDLDNDGHDDIRFTWGATTYLKPRLWGKDHFYDTSK